MVGREVKREGGERERVPREGESLGREGGSGEGKREGWAKGRERHLEQQLKVNSK